MTQKFIFIKERMSCKEKVETIKKKLGITIKDNHLVTIFWTYQVLVIALLYVIVRNAKTPSLLFIFTYLLITTSIPILLYDEFFLKHFQHCKVFADPTNKALFEIFGHSVSHWPVSHFFIWVCVTILCPQYWFSYLLLGIAWEGFEALMGMIKYPGKSTGHAVIKEKSVQYTTWWAHSPLDMVANIAGISLGLLLLHFFQN